MRLATLALAVVLVAMTMAGSASSVLSGGQSGHARLTGPFTVKLRVLTKGPYRNQRYTVAWAFVPGCDSGACSVTVSTLASSCVSGACAEPPSFLEYADEPLALTGTAYRGSFTIKAGSSTKTNSYPYGYEQHTSLLLHLTSGETRGGQALAKAFKGTLVLRGSPAPGYAALGCAPYTLELSFVGTSQTN